MLSLTVVITQEKLKILESPISVGKQLPVSVDLREFGLVTKPIDISFTNCGSAAVAAASITESIILYDILHYREHQFLENVSTNNLSVSAKYFLYTSTVYSENKGYYCTQQVEFILNDLLKLDTVQFSFLNNNDFAKLQFDDQSTQFNPEVIAVQNKYKELDTEAAGYIKDESMFVQPYYKDEHGNGLVILFHTPYFALDGDQPCDQDAIDLMKTYLAYGFTLMGQVHIDSDNTYQTFKSWNQGEVFAAPCNRVQGKYVNIDVAKMKNKISEDGFNRIQERIINVVIVGYGKKQGQDVWIVKFPFGPAFGNLGYMYFPILNNTLCLEQYIATVLPKNYEEGIKDGYFSDLKSNSHGLKQIYSILGLIDQMKENQEQEKSQNSASDQYTSRPQLAINTNPNVDEWQKVVPSVLSFNSIQCDFSLKEGWKEKVFLPNELFNCYSAVRIVFDSKLSTVQQSYQFSCTPESSVRFYCKNLACLNVLLKDSEGNDIPILKWICYNIKHQNDESINNIQRLILDIMELQIQTNTAACSNTNGVIQCTTQSPDYNLLKKFTTLPNPADGILLNNLIPYEAICEGTTLNVNCTRIVYDSESKINETWNCKPPNPLPTGTRHQCVTDGTHCNFTLICKGPDRDFTTGADPKPRTKMYSEIRQFATNCHPIGTAYYVCPPNYLMNSTIQRLRLNHSNMVMLKNVDILEPLVNASFTAWMYDFDFVQLMPLQSYNYTYNFKNARSQINFTSNISFNFSHLTIPKVRTMNMDCYIKLSDSEENPTDPLSFAKRKVIPNQYNCRLWNEDEIHEQFGNGELYVCNYTNFVCSAPLYGYSSNLLVNYSLVSQANIPLIFRKYNITENERARYELKYEAIQWDTSVVKVTGKDPTNFRFDPCSAATEDVYSDYCDGIVLMDLNMTCQGALCMPNVELMFQFEKVTTHENVTINNTVLPSIQSTSKSYCGFTEQLNCMMDRTNPKSNLLNCDKGKMDCQGASQTTFYQYSNSGVVAKQETGTSVYTFGTSDFSCSLKEIKDYKNIDGLLQVDVSCDIRNTQEHFSIASNSPDYLVRNANSIDEAYGMITLPGMNRPFQYIFSFGLIGIVLIILIVSFICALWPGEIKGGCAQLANKVCCCECCRFRCVDYDRFGVPMVVEEDFNSVFDNVDIKRVAIAFKGGFDGLSYENLSRALQRQEEKLATGQIVFGVKKDLRDKLKEEYELEEQGTLKEEDKMQSQNYKRVAVNRTLEMKDEHVTGSSGEIPLNRKTGGIDEIQIVMNKQDQKDGESQNASEFHNQKVTTSVISGSSQSSRYRQSDALDGAEDI